MMKRIAILTLLILVMGISLLAYNTFDTNKIIRVEEAKIEPEQLLKDKGYEVIESKGKVETYRLENDKLVGPRYGVVWGIQNFDVDDFIGKTIDTYSFVVKNHPLDNMRNNNKHQTLIWVLVCEENAIGGYSLPDYDELHVGGVYSLDGKTLEEVTGEDFQTWREKWENKYN